MLSFLSSMMDYNNSNQDYDLILLYKYDSINSISVYFAVSPGKCVTSAVLNLLDKLIKINVSQLIETIPNEAKAVEYLQKHGLIPETKECKNGHQMKLSVGTVIRWRCYLKDCRKQVGVRVGTWFQGTKMPLKTAIRFIYHWANEESSGERMKRELDLDPGTTVDWNSLLREVCLFMEKKDENMIGGKGYTVEVDETLLARRKNHAGRMLGQQWCFEGVCRETKECFVEPVADRTSETLMEVLKRRVHPETLIISDMWRGYSQVGASGYEHLKVNHKYNFVDPLTNAHTQNIERVWRSVKERSKKHNGTHRSMLDGYMHEFSWRRKNKNNEFQSILRDIIIFNNFLNEE
ncbi:Transposase, ISXO2-like domain-containing protein [Strongyloides ratti]|uniref:Transposase, ISXO2-like domain-containing protein n=1 Tax=Strongyloides ratti TaxID=34506 RepID=A0A090MT71_STRRB|nr:Transposase, ISXO2-like domain-containing protein [Strongyloides ratti]CEF61523.1 Transposase, ISXO2-like domain-containing protein [Strongyloides ratti]